MPFPKTETQKIAFWFSDYPERFLIEYFKNKGLPKTQLYCQSEFLFKEWTFRLDTQHCDFSMDRNGHGIIISRDLPDATDEAVHIIVPGFPDNLDFIPNSSDLTWTIMSDKEHFLKYSKKFAKIEKKTVVSPLKGLSKTQKYGYTVRVLFSVLSLFPAGMEWNKLRDMLTGRSYSLCFYPGFGKLRGTPLASYREAVYMLLNEGKIYIKEGKLFIRKVKV